MDVFRDSELAAQVVAWHNKHPLAMRIEIDQVRGIGSVCVPLYGLDDPIEPSPLSSEPLGKKQSGPGKGGLRAKASQQPTDADQTPSALGQAMIGGSDGKTAPRKRRDTARAAFDEDFIDPIRPGQIARFAARYGAEHDPFEGSAPTRHVPPAPQLASSASRVSSRYLRTVAIELPDRRVRLLVSASRWRRPVLLGPRLWSRPRCLAGVSLIASCLLLTVSTIHSLRGSGPAVHQMAEAASHPKPALNAVVSTSDPASAPAGVQPRSSVAAVLAASSAQPSASDLLRLPDASTTAALAQQSPTVDNDRAPSTSIMAAASPHTEAALRQELPIDLRPRLSSDTAREARRIADALREAAAQVAASPTTGAASANQSGTTPILPAAPEQVARLSTPPPGQVDKLPFQGSASVPAARARSSAPLPTLPGAAPQPLSAVAQGSPSYALVARQTRSRAASELLLGLMRDSEVPAGWPSTRTDVIPAANGFRAGWFPFATREEAEAARDHLLRTGLPTEVIEF
jgi:hypothetical protein